MSASSTGYGGTLGTSTSRRVCRTRGVTVNHRSARKASGLGGMAASSWMTCVSRWAGGWRWSSAPTRNRAAPCCLAAPLDRRAEVNGEAELCQGRPHSRWCPTSWQVTPSEGAELLIACREAQDEEEQNQASQRRPGQAGEHEPAPRPAGVLCTRSVRCGPCPRGRWMRRCAGCRRVHAIPHTLDRPGQTSPHDPRWGQSWLLSSYSTCVPTPLREYAAPAWVGIERRHHESVAAPERPSPA